MIAAIIVSYSPDLESLSALLKNLTPQVDCIYVVDNSDKYNNSAWHIVENQPENFEKIRFLRLGENLGIAVALNVGIEIAKMDGANWVLLSDQDSLPAPDMVENLLAVSEDLFSKNISVGAVGPTFTDLHTGLTYPFQVQRLRKLFYSQQRASDKEPIIEALTLITSGCLIPMHVLCDVGGMREDFFIDHVDIEWCHRARAKGYRIFGAFHAQMFQRMGDDRLKVWYFRWRYESAYSALRMYYRLRNFTILWKLNYVGWRWKVRASWYWLGFCYAQVVFGRDRANTLKMSILGVWDGLRGKMGKYLGNS